ncbi:KAP family P-loop NTPase fold protein [Aquimarina pacifica]|uniref:KAP family P-loop NTPase fold protein n=1 Tax=Aquimarina pacifica TaxID=1296415 RepID=UPI000471BC55|nr:P-loop NTPase fold protein [Aquimarina pacifica]
MTNTHTFSQEPITHKKDDLLGFEFYADKVKEIIRQTASDPSPLSIGVYGKWGEGKTSFLKLVERDIELFQKPKNGAGIIKYHFNPWMFDSQNEMLFEFFNGLSKRLFIEKNDTLTNIGKQLIKYSKYLKSVKLSASVGLPMLAGGKIAFSPNEVMETLGYALQGEEETLEGLRKEINTALKEYKHKIIIFIDDLDRLDKDEIYKLLKIVKLNANFENVVYFVALDHDQVAKAIGQRYGDGEEDGKVFLEKIFDIPIMLPGVRKVDLKKLFQKKLDTITGRLYPENKRQQLKLDEIVNAFPLMRFKSPREIYRTLHSFFIGAFAIGDEVNLYHLFWVEYIKVKYPELYNELKNYEIPQRISHRGTIIDFEETEINSEFMRIYHNDANVFGGTSYMDCLLNAYPQTKYVLYHLFYHKRHCGPKLEEEFHQGLCINHVNHYHKYFTYHISDAISRVYIYDLKKGIESKDITIKETILLPLLEQDKASAIQEFENILYFEDDRKNITFFSKLLLSILGEFDDHKTFIFKTEKENMLLAVGTKLKSTEGIDFKDFLEEFKLMSLKDLCYLRIYLEINDESIDQSIVNRLNGYENYKYILIESPESTYIIGAFRIWKDTDPKSFENFINSILKDKELLGLFIRNFAAYTYSNTNFFNAISLDNYEYLGSLVPIHIIVQAILRHYPSMQPFDDFRFSLVNESTIEDNIRQVFTYYKSEHQS